MAQIKFGTDGWRGIIAQNFTFDNVRACAQGVATYLEQAKLAEKGLVIGYDTRFASEHFAAAAAEVVAANGIKVYLCTHPAPTPVVSFGVRSKQAGGGIIITASHNPPMWNGFKYKTEDGASAPTDVVAKLERNIAAALSRGGVKDIPLHEAEEQGLVEMLDLAPSYNEHLSTLVDLSRLRKSRLKVVIDSMYGAGAGYLRNLLEGSSMKITEINSQRNPLFPGMNQPEPIEVNLSALINTVRQQRADVGIATDGDADRVGIVDKDGKFLTQLQVYALLAQYLLEVRGERGPIVKTITSTSMLYRLGEMYGVPVYETPVGFKYVAPLMMSENALIGGEESGGYGFRGHVPERDGILSALYFLDFMVSTGKSAAKLLEHLYSKVGPHYYRRMDIEFPEANRTIIVRKIIQGKPESILGTRVDKTDTTDGFRWILSDNSWLLIRFSGTEPLLRIYAETTSEERAQKMLDFGKELAGA